MSYKGSSVPANQSPTVVIAVTNQSRKVGYIWSAGFWVNHRLTLRDSNGKSPTPTRQGVIGVRAFGSLVRFKNVRIEIKPGATYRYELPPLRDFFRFKPGSYRVSVEYWDKASDPSTHLFSNTVELKFQ